MSSQRFNIEYFVKVNGGPQAASQINQVTKATQMNATVNTHAARSQTELTTATNKQSQANTSHTKTSKALAFGMLGMTTAAAEAVGMFSMFTDTQRSASEASQELKQAIADYGAESNEAKKATQELAKAERFANMTRRNMMLSMFDLIPFTVITVASIMKMVAAWRLHRTEQGLQAAANEAVNASLTRQITALNANGIATNVNTLAKQRFTAATTAASLATATSIGGFTNSTVALGRGAVATNVLTTATGGLRGALAKILPLLAKFGLAAAAIIAATAAYKMNLFGFRDGMDQIGVAIGNALPFLKGFLNTLKDLALAFPDFGKMWNVIKKALGFGGDEVLGQSAKKAEEMAKAIDELNKSSAEFVLTLSQMDKKEMKNAFSDLGIKGGAAKRMKGVLEDIEKIQQRIVGFSNAMQTLRQINIWEKLGLDVPESVTKKIFFAFEDRFDNISKMFEKGSLGRKMFEGLEKVMEKAAKNPGKAPEIVANYLANHPEIIKYLNQMGFTDEANALKAMADEAMSKGAFNLPKVTEDQKSQFLKDIGMEGESEWEKIGKELGTGIINGVKAVFTSGNFSGIGTALRVAIIDPLVLQLEGFGAALGSMIWAGLSDPVELNRQKEIFFSNLATAITNQTFWAMLGVQVLTLLFGGWTDFNAGLARIAAGFTNKAFWTAVGATTLTLLFTGWTDFNVGLQKIADALTFKAFWVALGATVLTNLFEGWTDFTAGLQKIADGFSGLLSGGGAIVETFMKGGRQILDLIVDGLMAAPELLAPIGQWIMDNIIKKIPGLGGLLAQIFPSNDVEGGGGGLGGGVGPQGGKFFEKLLISENGENPEGGGQFGGLVTEARVARELIKIEFLALSGELSNIWLGMSTNFSFFMNSLAINATSARTQILMQFLALSGELSNIWLLMATNFSAMMNSMGTNANSARTQIISAFLAMSGEASNIFLGLASNWSAMMNSMGANAQSGASQVTKAFKQMQSALSAAFKAIASAATSAFSKVKSSADSATSALKRQEQQAKRTAAAIRAIPSGGSRATGGLESAASGKFFTANGERTITIGDNPGGRESVAFIPHNDPGPTLEKIRQMFGNFDISARRGNASVRIGRGGDGGCVIQVFLDGEQMKGKIVKMISKNMGSFK